MEKSPPAFQFYPRQWLGDDKVMLMDWDAKAMHFHLICIAWQREQPCTIPNDEATIRKWVLQPTDEVWKRVWPQIKEAWQKGRGGLLVQRGLLAVYQKLMAHKEERSSTGKRGAESRWLSHGSAIGAAMKEPLAKNGSSSSSSSLSLTSKRLTPTSSGASAEPKIRKAKVEKTTVPFWQELVKHIDTGWANKKGAPYPWSPHEFKKLSDMARIYQPWGVMAMWDLYLGGTYFGKLTGYMIDGMKKDIGVIVDDSRFKGLARQYEEKLLKAESGEELISIKQITQSLGLVGGKLK